MSQSFDRGQFRAYRALIDIHLGAFLKDIMRDSQFFYDGVVIRYAGMEYEVPALKGVLGNWYVPFTDQTTQYRSQPANVQVQPATPDGLERGASFSMGRASEEEAVVGTMDRSKEMRTATVSWDQARLEQLRAQRRTAFSEHADSNPDAPPPTNAHDVIPVVEAVLMDDVDQQFVRARPVGINPTVGMASEAEMQQVAEANRRNQETILRKAAELSRLDPHKSREEMGGTRHDSTDQGTRKAGGKYGILRDEQDDGVPVGRYTFSGGATVGTPEDARNAAMSKPVDVTRVASQQPVQVGQAVASTPNRSAGAMVIEDSMTLHTPQAARARNTTQILRGQGNVGIDDISPEGTTGDVVRAASADDLEDLLPDAIVAGLQAPRRAPSPPKKTEAEEVQEIVDGWSIKRNWQKRVEEAVEFYGEWPEALEAIYTIESAAVVKQIKQLLAEASHGG